MNGVLFAQQDIQVNGTTKYAVVKASNHRFQASVPFKSIRLLNMTLSDHAWQKLDQNKKTVLHSMNSVNENNLPSYVQLGMNNVPVLDQGPYGTCVTFANTAAIEAAANKGDFISQLCQLELGQYFENNTAGSYASGWNGSVGQVVLSQISNFGVITKDIEKSIGCSGLTSYPVDGNIPANELTLLDYRKNSTDISDSSLNVGWSSLMDFYQAFADNTNRDELLLTVKDTLNKGDRLTFGVLLFAPQTGFAGAVAKHNVTDDTWVITPMINMMINSHENHGGHEMIITGYDDDAIATDDKGRVYKGLLTLRNSWGINAGDQGNFYMSYDYFKRLAVEVQRIRQL